MFRLPLIVCCIYGNFATDFGKGGFMMKNYILLFVFFFLAGITSMMAQVDPSEDSREHLVEMDNFVLNDAIKMYPNPVQNILSVHSSFPLTGVEVYSLLGERVKKVTHNFAKIDLRDLNSGIYMIKIYSNQFSVTKKLIKK